MKRLLLHGGCEAADRREDVRLGVLDPGHHAKPMDLTSVGKHAPERSQSAPEARRSSVERSAIGAQAPSGLNAHKQHRGAVKFDRKAGEASRNAANGLGKPPRPEPTRPGTRANCAMRRCTEMRPRIASATSHAQLRTTHSAKTVRLSGSEQQQAQLANPQKIRATLAKTHEFGDQPLGLGLPRVAPRAGQQGCEDSGQAAIHRPDPCTQAARSCEEAGRCSGLEPRGRCSVGALARDSGLRERSKGRAAHARERVCIRELRKQYAPIAIPEEFVRRQRALEQEAANLSAEATQAGQAAAQAQQAAMAASQLAHTHPTRSPQTRSLRGEARRRKNTPYLCTPRAWRS